MGDHDAIYGVIGWERVKDHGHNSMHESVNSVGVIKSMCSYNQDDYMYTEKYPDPNARDCGPFTIMGQGTQMVVSSNKAMIVLLLKLIMVFSPALHGCVGNVRDVPLDQSGCEAADCGRNALRLNW